MNPLQKHTDFVKKTANALGFSYCGIAKAGFLEEEAPKLEQWLKNGYQGKMGYLENHFDKRLDPQKLVPGSKSIISLIYNYFPPKDLTDGDSFKIAKYAYGKDYHFVIKDKLKTFFELMKEEVSQEIEGRVFVDSAPVHERAWAAKAGLGWIGKNSLLLNKSMGSFFFLAEIICDVELIADGPVKDYCGTCTRCIDACPTDAIAQPYVVDANKCISYLTIELKDELPSGFEDKMEDWIFGCDICQDVCPWNRFSYPHQETAFLPHEQLEKVSKRDWEELTEETFRVIFKNSAVKRTKFKGLKRNISYSTSKDL